MYVGGVRVFISSFKVYVGRVCVKESFRMGVDEVENAKSA